MKYDLPWGNKKIRFNLAGQAAEVEGRDINQFLWELRAPIFIALSIKNMVVGQTLNFPMKNKDIISIRREK